MTLFHKTPATAAYRPEIRPEASPDWIEQSIIRAYVQLIFPQEFGDGKHMVTFGRFDDLEVRLTEVSIPKTESETPHQLELWLRRGNLRISSSCGVGPGGWSSTGSGSANSTGTRWKLPVKFVGDAARRARNLH